MHRFIQIFRFHNLPLAGLIVAACLISSHTEVIAKPNPEKKAKRLFNSGIDLKDKGDFEGALSKFEAAIEIYPEYIEATFACGVVSYALGNYEKAKDDFTRTIELDTENVLAYYLRGKTNIFLENPKESLNDISKAIELDPNNAHLYFERAIIKSELSDFSSALDDYNNAAHAYREDLESIKKRVELENIGKVESYIQSVKINSRFNILMSSDTGARVQRLGRSSHIPDKNKRFDNLSDLAYQRFRSLQITYMRRGELRAFLGNIDGAIEDFSEAFRIKENSMSFGFFQYMIGNYELAVQTLKTRIEQNPAEFYSRFFLFLTLSNLGEHEKAGKYLHFEQDKKKKAKPDEWPIQITDFLLDKIDEASFIKATYNDDKYINLEQLCEAFFYTAQVHLLNGNESKAKEYLQKCLLTRISHYYEYMIAIIQLKLRLKNYTAESL